MLLTWFPRTIVLLGVIALCLLAAGLPVPREREEQESPSRLVPRLYFRVLNDSKYPIDHLELYYPGLENKHFRALSPGGVTAYRSVPDLYRTASVRLKVKGQTLTHRVTCFSSAEIDRSGAYTFHVRPHPNFQNRGNGVWIWIERDWKLEHKSVPWTTLRDLVSSQNSPDRK
jgi:hypothetical protein